MKKIQKHIEIVRSTTPRLSSLSRSSCEAVVAVLEEHYATVGVTIINDPSDLDLLVAKQPDLVFLGMKYVPKSLQDFDYPDQRIWISEFLDKHDIIHTGSGVHAITLEFDKSLAKQRVRESDLRTAASFVTTEGKPYANTDISLQFPLFVKPTDLGGGQGIDDNSVVHTIADLNTKIKAIYNRYTSDSLVEEYLPGREFSVAVLKDEDSGDLLAMPIELVAPANEHGDRILSQRVKALDQESHCPVNDVTTKVQISDMAIAAFEALGARDYGRIDIRLDADGVPHFLEANLIPCLIEDYGNFPKACALNIGMNFQEMLLSIVRLGFARTEHTPQKESIEHILDALFAPNSAPALPL